MASASQEQSISASACFVVTSPAMVNLLTSSGPAAMGGAELQLYLLGRALREKGWEISFLVRDYGQERRAEGPNGIRLLRAYSNRGEGLPIGALLRSLREFWRALDEVDADIYVSRGLTGQAGVLAAYAKLRRRRYVFWFGKNADAWYGVPWLSGLPAMQRLSAWYGIRAADAVIVQTNDQQELLRKHVGRSGFVVPNAVPWEDGTPKDDPGEYALWVGSMQPKKRPGMLLDVAARTPDVRFVMAGGRVEAHRDLYQTVQARANKLPNVDFLGFVPFSDTKRLFERASALVSTSKGDEEGFPNVFLQAWSTGTPVVATCDPDQAIRTHGLGYYCTDAPSIAERIRELVSSPELQQQLGLRAYDYCAAHHSLGPVVDKLNAFLLELLNSESPGH